VTPAILAELFTIDLNAVPGFSQLKYAVLLVSKYTVLKDCRAVDQSKIRVAVVARQVNPADIPSSAKAPVAVAITHNQSQKKRKATDPATPSSAATSSRIVSVPNPAIETIEVDDDDNDNANDDVDELYTTLRTNVVGIQYYTGESSNEPRDLHSRESCSGLVGPGEEVSLQREPHNRYDR
jgi:SWI/SNF-related matrix-associated actin-dependent regulator of chromatin subfamily A3